MLIRSKQEWEAHKRSYSLPYAACGEPDQYPCYAKHIGYPIDNPNGPYEYHYAFFYLEDAVILLQDAGHLSLDFEMTEGAAGG